MAAAEQNDPGLQAPFDSIDADASNPVLGTLFEYWASKCGTREIPKRGDIDPIDIPDLLPHIGLIDVEHAPRRFRYRLVGSHMNTLFGVNYQGTYLDESKRGLYCDFLSGVYGDAVDARLPVVSEASFDYGPDREVLIRRLVLPLAEQPNAPINMLLFANVFDAPNLPTSASAVMQLSMEAPFDPMALSSIQETRRQILRAGNLAAPGNSTGQIT